MIAYRNLYSLNVAQINSMNENHNDTQDQARYALYAMQLLW